MGTSVDPSGRLERVCHCGWTTLGVTAHWQVCGSGHEDSPELGEIKLCRVVKLGALYMRIVGIAGNKTNSHHCVLYLIPDELITAVIYLGFIVCLFFSTLLFTWTYSFLHWTYCCAPRFVYHYGHCVFECCVNWTLLGNCVYLNWYYCLYMLGMHCVFMIYCGLHRGLHWVMEHGILNGACDC